MLSSPERMQYEEGIAETPVQAIPIPARWPPLLSAWETTASEGKCTSAHCILRAISIFTAS